MLLVMLGVKEMVEPWCSGNAFLYTCGIH